MAHLDQVVVKPSALERVTLTLTGTEAQWLKAVLQNPLHGVEDPADELPGDQVVRHSIFTALAKIDGPF